MAVAASSDLLTAEHLLPLTAGSVTFALEGERHCVGDARDETVRLQAQRKA